MIKVVAAANAMKGSLSASSAAASIAKGVRQAFTFFEANHGKNLPYTIIEKPVADGGDDTVDAIAEHFYATTVCGPLGSPINAKWGSFGKTAVIEMAKASGLTLVPSFQLDPFQTTTYGTGQLISKAIDSGFKDILLTIGGSATIDGGIGAISALGAKFFNQKGQLISKPFGNKSIAEIYSMDLTNIHKKCKDVKISIACDVDNPLLGPNGSAAIFGPQKIAPKNRSPQAKLNSLIGQLDRNLAHLSMILEKETGKKNIAKWPGSGAAGGFPLSFCSILDAKMANGSKLVLKLINFDKLKGADIVVTCEGRCDNQTLHGKGPYEVCKMMKGSHIIMLSGGIESFDVEKGMLNAGANIVSALADGPSTLENSIQRTDELLQRSAFRYVYSYLSTKYV